MKYPKLKLMVDQAPAGALPGGRSQLQKQTDAWGFIG